jgi:hypothetical protein
MSPMQTAAHTTLLAASKRRLAALARLTQGSSLNPKDLAVTRQMQARLKALEQYQQNLTRTL